MQTDLHEAAAYGDATQVESLLKNFTGDDKPAFVDARDPDGRTPLRWAAKLGNEECVEILITKGGANGDAVDDEGKVPLHYASENGHTEVMKLLLRGGASVDAPDSQGQTALHLAAKWEVPEAVELLIANGANEKAKDFEGNTPNLQRRKVPTTRTKVGDNIEASEETPLTRGRSKANNRSGDCPCSLM